MAENRDALTEEEKELLKALGSMTETGEEAGRAAKKAAEAEEAEAADAFVDPEEKAAEGSEGAKKPEEAGKADGAGKEEKGSAEAGGQEAKDKKEEKKDPKSAKIAELNDKYLRLLAEFENFRTRSAKEKSSMFDLGSRNVLEKFLPVIDNFERALATVPESAEAKAYADGMAMVYRQLMKGLEDAGVTAMDCRGKAFDPNLHNAVMHVDDESLGENVVAEELQKGYLYKGSVLRFAMVKVAN